MGSIAASFDYGLNAAATEYDGQNKYLRITDIDDVTHEFLKSDLTTPLADLAMSAVYLLEEGDLLFARTGASVGKTYLYRQYDGTVYFAGFLIRARIGENANPEFVYQATLTDAYKKFVAITSQRSGQPGVNAQEYADYQLMLPSRTEQQQIGMTLRSLDNLITLHQCTCHIFYFCAHGSRANFASTPQGQLRVLRYPRPIPKMLVSPSSPVSGVFDAIEGARGCGSSSAIASTPSPSARKKPITSTSLCCRDSLSSP